VFNLQGSEIIVILLLALVVLGPDKLPEAIRKFTQTYSEFKKMSSGFQSELKSALDEPMREMRATANLVRDAVDPDKIVAEAEAEQRLRDDAHRVSDEAYVEKPVSPGGPVDQFAVDPLDVEPPTLGTESNRESNGESNRAPDIDPELDEPPDEAAAS